MTRRFALATAVVMYLLIVVGATVRLSGSGLGCPDWPLCHGRPYPPADLHAIIEYSHRSLAFLTSVLLAATAASALFRDRDRRWTVIPAVTALLLLVVQIALGAIVVKLELPAPFVSLHLATAMAIFATILVVIVGGQRGTLLATAGADRLSSAWRRALAAGAGVYILIITGAIVVAVPNADDACPSFPFCGNGALFPASGPGSYQMFHRLMMFLVAILAIWAVAGVERLGRDHRHLKLAARALMLAFVVQVTVGIVMVTNGSPGWIEGVHVGTATLVWTAAVVLALLVRRSLPDSFDTAGTPA